MKSKQVSNRQLQIAALTIALIGSFLTPFMSASINIALPDISNEYGLNAQQLSWIATAYLLAAAMFLIPFGKLADIKGRKRIYLTGMIIYTLMSGLCTLSISGNMLIGFRLLQGMGGAMIFSTGVAILTSIFPKEKRGLALGWVIFMVYMGLSAGPTIGGILTNSFGWRSIFYVNLPIGLLVIVLIITTLKGEWAEAKDDKFDIIGSLFYGLSIVSIMYGLSLLPSIKGAYYLTPGLILLILFIRWEKKHPYPVLDTTLFSSNRVFALSNIAAFINYSATFAVTFLLSLYLQFVKGLNPKEAGIILVAQPLMMAIFSPLSGKISDRSDPRIIASIGMALTAAGLVFTMFFKADTTINYIIASLLVLGLGFALFSSPNTNAIMSAVKPRFYGIASATTGAMRLTGQMFSMGIAILILNLIIGNNPINPQNNMQFLEAMHLTLIIFACLCTLGIFASLARGKTRMIN